MYYIIKVWWLLCPLEEDADIWICEIWATVRTLSQTWKIRTENRVHLLQILGKFKYFYKMDMESTKFLEHL